MPRRRLHVEKIFKRFITLSSDGWCTDWRVNPIIKCDLLFVFFFVLAFEIILQTPWRWPQFVVIRITSQQTCIYVAVRSNILEKEIVISVVLVVYSRFSNIFSGWRPIEVLVLDFSSVLFFHAQCHFFNISAPHNQFRVLKISLFALYSHIAIGFSQISRTNSTFFSSLALFHVKP